MGLLTLPEFQAGSRGFDPVGSLAVLTGTRTVAAQTESNLAVTVQSCQQHIRQDCTLLAVASLERDRHSQTDCKEGAPLSPPAAAVFGSLVETVEKDILRCAGHTDRLEVEESRLFPGKSGLKKMELVASVR